MSQRFAHAIVLGKFLPTHQGHQALMRFALGLAKRVTVIVEEQPDEDIAVGIRARWIEEALSSDRVTVKVLLGPNPGAPPGDTEGDAKFWQHWNTVLRTMAPGADLLVSGELYGQKLAHDLGAAWRLLDRRALPISATWFKASPWERWWWLIPPARVAMLRRALIIGSESTGKSVLAKHLATGMAAPTVHIPEMAEPWIRAQPEKTIDGRALAEFLEEQALARESLAPMANRWLMEDSHALTTAVWAEHLGFPEIATRAYSLAQADPPDEVILTSSLGALWIQDDHRKVPEDRQKFDALFRLRLDQLGWRYSVIEGDWDQRTRQAEAIRDAWIDKWHNDSWSQWCWRYRGGAA